MLSLMASMASFVPSAFALPDQGAYDNSAYASIVVNGNVMNIAGNYGNNIINWCTFSVASGETVKFTDKNNYLNLVNGIDTSIINGTISGGGIVYLINPYGILFGSGATLDNVGSFVASTRDISDINQEAFINNPADVQNVLYTNEHQSRNKDYYPDNSPFVPTISVAEMNLTNVPASATAIVLDSPGGVILKDTATLDKTLFVSTQKNGGEIGIGVGNEGLALTEEQKGKIALFDGSNWYRYNEATDPDIVQAYKQIHNVTELQNINQEAKNNSDDPKRYVLANDIDASGFAFKSLGSDNDVWKSFNNISYTEKGFYGTFDGLGYKISNLQTTQGLFTSFSGKIRNLSMENVRVEGQSIGMTGGVAGYFNGSMSNVHCTGYLSNRGDVGGLVGLTFVDGIDGLPNDIRNSSNDAEIHSSGSGGGIAGLGSMSYIINSYNTGNIDLYRRYRMDAPQEAGGIVGFLKDDYNKGVYILATYNTGTVTGSDNVGGIGGFLYVPVGDSYNFGKLRTEKSDFADRYPDGERQIGGISGLKPYTYTSKTTNEPMTSYYVQDFENKLRRPVLNFGEELSSSALQAKFDENQKNRVATLGVTTPVIPNNPPTPNTPDNHSASPSNPQDNTAPPISPNTPSAPMPPENPSAPSNPPATTTTPTPTPTNDETPQNPIDSIGGNSSGQKSIIDLISHEDNAPKTSDGSATRHETIPSDTVVNAALVANQAYQDAITANQPIKKGTPWDVIVDAFQNFGYYLRLVFNTNNAPASSTTSENPQLQRLATELESVSNQSAGKITKSGSNGTEVPPELVNYFANAISNALWDSVPDNQSAGQKEINLALAAYDGIPKMEEKYKINGTEYVVEVVGGVQSGKVTAQIWWTDKDNHVSDGQLDWSGSGTASNFLSSLKEYGKDKCEAVYEACALDAIGVIKWLKDDSAEVPKLIKEALGNKATKEGVKQVIKGMPEGTKFLQKLANFAYDAYLE